MAAVNWSSLEQQGLITPPPGREEAVRATLEHMAAKKAAAQAVKPKSKSK
jgi:hypothetical protein